MDQFLTACQQPMPFWDFVQALLPWILLLSVVEPLLSSCMCAVVPLPSNSSRFVSLIDSNISGSSSLLFSIYAMLVTLIVSQVLPLIIPQA